MKGEDYRPAPTTTATPPALRGAVAAWADATTDPSSPRRRDLHRDKAQAVLAFLATTGKPLEAVRPGDVKRWQQHLEARGLAEATVYAFLSRVSSFFRWAMGDPELAARLPRNPVDLARPRAPKPYQSESIKALDDDQVQALLGVVAARATTGHLPSLRDYALLLLLFLTGLRRNEVIRLRWGDIDVEHEGLVLRTIKLKGGTYRAREVRHPAARRALLAYLAGSGRLANMTPETPLWTRHDRAGSPGAPLRAHALALNVKQYAAEAGIPNMHLHRTRHTFARMVSEDLGSLLEVQEALGHRHAAVTRAYVQRIAVQKDRYSQAVGHRLGV